MADLEVSLLVVSCIVYIVGLCIALGYLCGQFEVIQYDCKRYL
jgi:hypothetical protein